MYFSQGDHPSPTFPDDVVQIFKNSLIEFFDQHGVLLDWHIRGHQPMHLLILKSFSDLMQDRDQTLFPALLDGGGDGVFITTYRSRHVCQSMIVKRIRKSHSRPTIPIGTLPNLTFLLHNHWFRKKLTKAGSSNMMGLLKMHRPNGQWACLWASWALHIPMVEVHGWFWTILYVVSIRDVGVPERSTLPTCKDILRTFPIREFQGDHMAFELDIKAAHKRIVLHEDEQGLVGFTLNEKLYFYRVTPFGAVFSAHWWARLGGFLLRIFHRLIWWAHTGLLYVDDYFFTQCSDMMPVSATLICLLCQICRIPISWGKCELGGTIQWIGWTFHITAGYIEIPQRKLSKLLAYILEMKRSSRTTRRHFEKLIGLAMWITQLWPYQV